MQDIAHQLSTDGFARIGLDRFSRQQIAQLYACWTALFQSGAQAALPGNPAIPIGFVPLRSASGYEMKESVYVQPDFPLPGCVAGPTKRFLRDIGRLAEGVSQVVRPHVRSADLLQWPRHGCLRVMHYPAFEGGDDAVTMRSLSWMGHLRAPPHTDLNALTFLPPATIAGLEIFARDTWIPLDDPEELIVLAGRELEAVGKGSFPAAVHRVRNPEREEERKVARLSLAYFIA
ncbi:2OG-Fe(II) oxygenase family protein [Sphingomonas sp. ASY06-1R]|uniref:2OG-Fe(II) oxygenase family protein n=1 Tax=Sphingomonas sp. ASY06-1R TaxID=3445771 RepID=UPI003FA3061F